MRYFRDGVLKMIIKKVLPGDGSTFLYHNSGSFHGKVNPFSVVDQMKIHGILCAERVVGCDSICNLTMSFDCLLMQSISGAFHKKRNRAVDHRNQPRYHNILTAQGNGSVKFNYLFVCDPHDYSVTLLLHRRERDFFMSFSSAFVAAIAAMEGSRRKRTSRRSWISFCLFPIKVNPRGSSTIPGEEAI